MRKLLAILVLVLACVSTNAQMMNPVHFTTQLKELKNGEAELIFKATIDAGWHVYSTGLGNDGPISASFNKVKMDAIRYEIDHLEMIVEDGLWSLPKYRELLFIR